MMRVPALNNDYCNLPSGGNRFSGWCGNTLLRLIGWKIKGGLPNVPKAVIAVGPHSSNWDFFLGVAVLFALRIKIRFLGKHTIFKPGLRIILNWLGGIPVDRRHRHGVVEQISQVFKHQQKMILALAPEGTRSPIYPWKTGFLSIAQRANVPVVLIGFDFALRQVIIGPMFTPCGDTKKDMRKVYDFFKSVRAKYPDKVLFSGGKQVDQA